MNLADQVENLRHLILLLSHEGCFLISVGDDNASLEETNDLLIGDLT